MTEQDFILKTYNKTLEKGSFSWQAPSNIALVKYWGKFKNQIPANPSISFTLNNCNTKTTLTLKKRENNGEFSFDVFLDNTPKPDFKPKIKTFFKRIETYCPYLKNYHFTINTTNTFPHSSGIASSASGMSALALCLMSLEKELIDSYTDDYFYKKASFLARLGSGSACRSVKGNIVVWGKHKAIKNSSDLFGIEYPYTIHKDFNNYQDTILLVDKGQKQVSSTIGHELMENHPFSKQRFKQANKNLKLLIKTFDTFDLEKLIRIVESEALTLHSMMMTSKPYFILMKPNTLKIINRIWRFRKETKTPICFTLDAGANVHVLYPEAYKDTCLTFIKNELIGFCQNKQYICDTIGFGAKCI